MKLTKRSYLLSTVALMSAGAAIPVLAQTKIPAAIQAAVDSGLKFEKSFPAAGGLTGWVLSQGPNNNVILYTPANGEVALAGNLFDAKGTNLNKQYLEKFGPKPDFEKMWGELEASAWITEGPKGKDAKSYIYVFEDPNCGFCHLAWKALHPYTKAGLQVRWIPVAFLAADSANKAAALLTAADPDAALAEQQANFGKKTANLKPVPEAVKAKLEANAKLMKQWGFTGTPATFYKDKSGKVRSINGMFNLSDLPEITGMAEIKNNDPELARFR